MEARIQTGALPAVGWSVVFALCFFDGAVETGNQGRQECLIQNELQIYPVDLWSVSLEMPFDRNMAAGRSPHLKAIMLVARTKYRCAIEILVDAPNAITELDKIVKVECVIDDRV